MLGYLRIRGLALLDDVTVELDPGLNVLTGETGAGKSIIVDALTLLRGTRVRADIVRTGRDAATVDAEFNLSPELAHQVDETLDRHGIKPSDSEASLVVQRSVARTGRGRTFLNAELTTLEVLSQVGELLVDICSQHEHHSLTQVARHIELLDGFAGAGLPLKAYVSAYQEYRTALEERAALVERSKAANERSEFLRFQLEELERVAPQPGEFDQLKQRLGLLRNAQRWAELARDAEQWLCEADDSISERLGRLHERARRGADQSHYLVEFAEQMQTAQIACDEALRIVQRFVSELDVEPGALERAEERFYELSGLQRKHGTDAVDLPAKLATLRRELEELEHATETLALLDKRVQLAQEKAAGLAQTLHEKRRKAAHQLAAALKKELTTLHMPLARFDARVESMSTEALGPRGFDRVEFLLSANPGEDLAPLTRVASGGELSRVLLAVRGVLSGSGGVATYVFDEVDAGVGGAIAASIGQRLASAARSNQVICVTHLPQIAAFADAHFRVEKRVENERTTTQVVRLSEEERVDELARMLGGARITESARNHARQLIEDAKGKPAPQREAAASATKRSSRP
ncbi:MAG TPA: DNA repair protein RecN [Polyangiaceae bacterium]|nr:DNA repair protein RecN [Polyangiaceae bacterium]